MTMIMASQILRRRSGLEQRTASDAEREKVEQYLRTK